MCSFLSRDNEDVIRSPKPGDLPTSARQLASAVDSVKSTVIKEGRGMVVLVAGDSSSGRTALLAHLGKRVRGLPDHPYIIEGSFESGDFSSLDESGPQRNLEMVATAGAFASVIAPLLSQILNISTSAWKLREKMAKSQPDSWEAVSLLIKAAATERPLLIILHDVHKARGSWWNNLLLSLAHEIAQVPIALFLGVDGPPNLPPVGNPDEPDYIYLARKLLSSSVARWWPVERLCTEDVERWLGSADEDVVATLLDLAQGQPRQLVARWQDWTDRHVVVKDAHGAWQFLPNLTPNDLGLDHFLAYRLESLLGSADARQTMQARELLGCAALEGRSFTAEAVASATRREADAVIDFLDEWLATGDERPEGLVFDEGFLSVQDREGQDHHLCRYSFASDLAYFACRESLTEEEASVLRPALADGLARLTGGGKGMARKIAALYRMSGMAEAARLYQRIADFDEDLGRLMLHADRILASDWSAWDSLDRSRSARLLRTAGFKMLDNVPADKAGAVFDGAIELEKAAAETLDVSEGLAEALRGRSWAYHNANQVEAALETAKEAVNIAEQSGDLWLSLAMWYHRNVIEAYAGHDKCVIQCFLRISELAEQMSKPVRGVDRKELLAGALNSLGVHVAGQGSIEAGRLLLDTALLAAQEAGSSRIEAYVLINQAQVDVWTNDLRAARQRSERAVAAAARVRDALLQARVQHTLGLIYLAVGDHRLAQRAFRVAAHLHRQLGDHGSEGRMLAREAYVARVSGEVHAAEALLEQAKACLGTQAESLTEVVKQEVSKFGQLPRVRSTHGIDAVPEGPTASGPSLAPGNS